MTPLDEAAQAGLDSDDGRRRTEKASTAHGSGIVRMTQVAAESGVSVATVSRYLRGHTVRRADAIQEAIERLKYRPNAMARGLRSQTTQAVGVVVHDITNPFSAAVVSGVQSVAGPGQYSLYLAGGRTMDMQAMIADVALRVDGIIFAAATEGSHAIEALEEAGKPTVLLEFEPSDQPHEFDTVKLDNVGGARLAVEHLLGLGHTRIGIVAGPDSISVGRERLEGALQALTAAGIDLDTIPVEPSDFTTESGYQATARLMGRAEAPTAIFTPNNTTSLGCLQCLHDLAVAIPERLSFVGFDPLPSCDLLHPPPTTIDRPEVEQGVLAMRMLENRMAGRGTSAARRVVLETRLVVRGSSAPPPA